MENQLLTEIGKLTVAERIILVEDIWNGIVDADENLDLLTDFRKAELDRRLAAYEANPSAGRNWQEIKSEMLGANR